jgi:hypothetical protein
MAVGGSAFGFLSHALITIQRKSGRFWMLTDHPAQLFTKTLSVTVELWELQG